MIDEIKWLTEVRKLEGHILRDLGVGVVQHETMGQSVGFPYKRNGETYAAKYRKLSKKDWRSTQGVSRGLFNEDCLIDIDGAVIITEGEMDAISCIQAGYQNSVSLPDGWNAKGDKRDCLVKESERLLKSDFVIVAGDNDEAGKSLPKAVAAILQGHDVRFAVWPDDCKDANDVLVKYGVGRLTQCLDEAKMVDPVGGFVTSIADLPPMPQRRVLKCGLLPFDNKLAFEVGSMSVGTGMPGFGKSTFTTFVAHQIANHEKIRIGLLPFETHPFRIRDHIARLRFRKEWDNLNGVEEAKILEWSNTHLRIGHRTYTENTGHHLGWLKNMVHTMAVRDNCKLIIIDPWNEIEHLPEKGESLTNYINFALQQIRTWADQFDCHICVIAHPKKINNEGTIRPPMGYDIADSAAFSNKPSLGFTVHQSRNDHGDEYVEIFTWKVRDTQFYGISKGSMKLDFDHHLMRYVPFESSYKEEAA